MTAAELAWAFDRLILDDLPPDEQYKWKRLAAKVEDYVDEEFERVSEWP